MIHSRANARLKDMRRARRCKGDLALIEGPHLLREALACGLVPDTVLATSSFLASAEGGSLAAILPRPPIEVDPSLLDELADSDSPRGIVATVARPQIGVDAIPVRADGVYVYLDGVQDPGNLGAIARVAEASGATALVLALGCAHPNHPRALRASAGSLLRLPVAQRVVPQALDAHLASESDPGPTWIALEAHAEQTLYEASFAGSLVLALGAEGPGLSSAVGEHAGCRVRIPMAPPVESLNVATAATVVLFELSRRR